MIRSLHIENIAVIKNITIDFSDGFTAFTGETGAGKSMIIDGINLLLCNKVSKDIIRNGEEIATVSAVFDGLNTTVCDALKEYDMECDDGELLVLRSITIDGKSKYKINGQPVTQQILKNIVSLLISIHGQNDTHTILSKSSHLRLLDEYAKPDEILLKYKNVFTEYKDTKKKLTNLKKDLSDKAILVDTLTLQIKEIEEAKLKVGEEEELLEQKKILANSEIINKNAGLSFRALHGSEKMGALGLVSRAKDALKPLSEYNSMVDNLIERLASVESEIEDISAYVYDMTDHSGEDPSKKLDKIEDRLSLIHSLEKKYGADITDVLEHLSSLKMRLSSIEQSENAIEDLEYKANNLYNEAKSLADKLTKIRKTASQEISKKVVDFLSFLDMPKVNFSISVENCELNDNGADDVEFLIATNIGEPLMPLISIASGGELSRIMLALRSVLNDKEGASTIIYDEIDTGISGKTSRKVGLCLKNIAKDTQVVCVTHSAQIASLAQNHLFISKTEKDGRMETSVKTLTNEERVDEIARILGGINITDSQRKAAEELLYSEN